MPFEHSPIITILLGLRSPCFVLSLLSFDLRKLQYNTISSHTCSIPTNSTQIIPTFLCYYSAYFKTPTNNHIRQQSPLNRRSGVDFMCFPINCITTVAALQYDNNHFIRVTTLILGLISSDPKPTSLPK